MIVSFSVANFSLLLLGRDVIAHASNRVAGDHEDHAMQFGFQREVLRTAVLYGANGAGKSNVFKAPVCRVCSMELVKEEGYRARAVSIRRERRYPLALTPLYCFKQAVFVSE